MSQEDEIRRAAAILRNGGLVAFPTETVYGLGANALDPAAVAKIFEAKGRPRTSPVIVHVDTVAMAKSLVSEWPRKADILTERFWPGPLTLVLPKDGCVPDLVTAGLPNVGVRMPAHPIALALVREAGVPIAAPSANRFTQLSTTQAEHVRESLGESVDLVLEGGPTTVGIESTVLSLVGDTPRLLRPGGISRLQLEEVIGSFATRSEPENGAHASPGLHPRHYSPRTPLFLLPADARLPEGKGLYLQLHQARPGITSARMPSEPTAYARVLYSTLHEADHQGFDWIAVEEPPNTAEWEAVLDRLRRAAHKS